MMLHFVKTLARSVSQLGTEKLAMLDATSHTISTGLLSVQSEVLAMSTPLQGMHNTLSRVETRFDDLENLFKQLLVRNSTINGTPSEVILPVYQSCYVFKLTASYRPPLRWSPAGSLANRDFCRRCATLPELRRGIGQTRHRG
jgi:hypothetical protein